MRNRDGRIVGLTCRAGRAVPGSAAMAADLVASGKSILFMVRAHGELQFRSIDRSGLWALLRPPKATWSHQYAICSASLRSAASPRCKLLCALLH